MPLEQNRRPIEAGVHRDLAQRLTYGEYLCIDELLSIQRPVSSPEHHDELLFIIQHQTSELWLKLIVHELRWAIGHLAKDDVGPCLKALARIKHVQKQLFEQWAVLATLTPSEYAQFRDDLGPASGFQSVQYRLVEYLLGNKNSEMLEVFAHDPAAVTLLHKTLTAPSLYDEFLRYLNRTGHRVPVSRVERDWTQPYLPDDGVVAVFAEIYQSPSEHWQAYELAEELVDLEESFQLWRFRHMHTVKRIIGHKRGTGGSSGVGFLRAALDLTFFPELFEVRTEIGSRRADG